MLKRLERHCGSWTLVTLLSESNKCKEVRKESRLEVLNLNHTVPKVLCLVLYQLYEPKASSPEAVVL